MKVLRIVMLILGFAFLVSSVFYDLFLHDTLKATHFLLWAVFNFMIVATSKED